MNEGKLAGCVTCRKTDNVYTTYGYNCDHEIISECRISVDAATKIWTISSWFTHGDYKHHGYGKKVLKECINDIMVWHPLSKAVRYIWNGQNEYVLKWLVDRFDAKCTCPVAVQKYAADDDWDSHVYELDAAKFMNYIEHV